MSSPNLCLNDLYQYVLKRIIANPTCPIRISTSWPSIDSDQASDQIVLLFIASDLVDKAFKEEDGLSIQVRKGRNLGNQGLLPSFLPFLTLFQPSFSLPGAC